VRPRKLPPAAGVRVKDFYWESTREEIILERLNVLRAQQIKQQRLRDQELRAMQAYFEKQREEKLAAEDKARREKALQLMKEINADINKFDRAELARRGVIRGRR
jgi:hypothetical protein